MELNKLNQIFATTVARMRATLRQIVRTKTINLHNIKELFCTMNGPSKQAAAPFKKPWPLPGKELGLADMLEKLDRILNALDDLADAIAEHLGLLPDEASDGGDTEELDSSSESEA